MLCLRSLVAIVLSVAAGAAQAGCLKANADGQTAEGKLTSVVVSIPDYRLKEQAYILQLATPACLDGEDFDKVEKSERIHVYAMDEHLRKLMRRLVGRSVRVQGSPFGEETAHHHAPIVMSITAIERLPPR